MAPRVIATEEAIVLIARLKEKHGALLLHQSGGCRDGSSPTFSASGVSQRAERRTLGRHRGLPVYIGAAQFELWRHAQLIIDVVPSRGAGFSVEAPEELRFLARGRVFSEAELTSLREAPSAA
ncbi:MAG: DUF779 domain-containing protein [Methylocella sp.]